MLIYHLVVYWVYLSICSPADNLLHSLQHVTAHKSWVNLPDHCLCSSHQMPSLHHLTQNWSFSSIGLRPKPLSPFSPRATCGGTWMRVSFVLVIGLFVHLFYGQMHSSLINMICMPTAHAEECYNRNSEALAERNFIIIIILIIFVITCNYTPQTAF